MSHTPDRHTEMGQPTPPQTPWEAGETPGMGLGRPYPGSPPRGVVLLMVTGAIQFLLFGCLGSLSLAAAGTDLTEVRQEIISNARTPEQEQMARRVADSLDTIMTVLAVGTLVVLALPGLALVLLGLGVRKGSRRSATAAKVILWIQVGLIGLLVTLSLPGLVGPGAPASAVSMLPMVALLVLLIMTAVKLQPGIPPSRGPSFAAGFDDGSGHRAPDPDEPWNTR